MNSVEARDLVKDFGKLRAVDGISFDVRNGETFAILGENGAGKSTTMRMIACRSPVTSGELLVRGLNVSRDARAIRSVLGVVPQENNLDPDLNVLENLLVYARYFRIPKEAARLRSLELLDFIKLTEKKYSKVDTLSGGMKRRLIIVRALLHKPAILLLDEPTTGLDPNVRHEIWEKLEDLRQTENITIVLSTHYMDEAEKLSGRLIVLSRGKIVASGVPNELIRRNVMKFALEVRDVPARPLFETNSRIMSQKRGTAHLYFAENADELTHLVARYDSGKVLLRPSNLEDVFLRLLEQDEF